MTSDAQIRSLRAQSEQLRRRTERAEAARDALRRSVLQSLDSLIAAFPVSERGSVVDIGALARGVYVLRATLAEAAPEAGAGAGG